MTRGLLRMVLCLSTTGLGLFALGCGGNGSTPQQVTVQVAPETATVIVNGTQQFQVAVTGATDTTVKWFVNDVEGGNTTVGTIDTTGRYTAPATIPSPANVTVKAVANADTTASDTATVTVDSGVRLSVTPAMATVGTGENLQFTASVTGTSNTAVSWFVNDVAGGNSTVGTIDAAGRYTAPTTIPSPATVTVKATSAADTNRSATASVTIATAADPTLTAISPTKAAQGSLFQDVYLTGTEFLSTTTVVVNGTPLPSSAVTLVKNTLLRARIPDSLLTTPSGPSGVPVLVQRQGGPSSASQNLVIFPVRPALVGTSPDSGTQGGAAFSFNINGGYFGTTSSPAVTAEFDGTVRAANVSSTNSARQLSVTIGPGDLTTPGLISVAVRNTSVTQPASAAQQVAVTNLAVQPSSSGIPSAPLASLAVGSRPVSVAVNTATGIAVVANHDSNNIHLIDLGTQAISGSPITVGNAPTGVAIDNVRNLAIVVNSGDKSLTFVDLGTRTVTATLDLSSVASAAPLSVAVSPQTGRALVAHQQTNAATLIDVTTNPPSLIGIVSASTGGNPQVAVEPRLNWAIVTPGGAGVLSIADLGRQTANAIAATGAVRTANVVTITTATPHSLTVGQPVLISGVGDSGFDGTFTAATVPSTTTFTYSQTASNANSGGGTVRYASALATATVGVNVRGIGINPETERALLADPTVSTLGFLSVLDQTVNSLSLGESGAIAAAFNPLTDVGVTINPNTDEVSVIDPRTPALLAKVALGAGADPSAVAIDPGSNLAVVANEGNNTVSIVSLGSIRPLHITQVNLPSTRQVTATTTLTSTTDLPLTIFGKGFVSGSVARVDGTPLPSPSSVSDRQMSVNVPAALLAGPRRFALDVVNPGPVRSNAADLTVIQPVDLTGSGCSAPSPRAIAIDQERNLAVVTRPGCDSIALLDLTTGAVSSTIAVGTNPQGVAVISRLSKAVVTNRGSNNASIVDLAGGTVSSTVNVGTEPIGVAIEQDTATAIVTNSGSNNISVFSADTGGTATNVSVDNNGRPVAVAIDSTRRVAAVANATLNNLNLFDISLATPALTGRIPGPQLPTSVVFDPVSRLFVTNSSLANSVVVSNPETLQSTAVRVGINPTSMAYNFLSSTLVTSNTASNTLTVMDFLDRRVRAVLGLGTSPACATLLGPSATQQQPCAVEIHPHTNLAVIADGDNHRVLLVPLPR